MEISEPIIPVSTPSCQLKSWKNELKTAISSVDELLSYVEINKNEVKQLIVENSDFKVRVPRTYLDKIEKGNIQDPLLLQVLPKIGETQTQVGFVKDPLNEQKTETTSLLHKYHGRALLILSGACAVNCRYCFRRHFPYAEHRFDIEAQTNALNYIGNDVSISEVIFSGGDPLMLPDKAIDELITALENIPHVKRLRIHTRLPVMIASRLTLELAQRLSISRFAVSIVLHINHPNEIDDALARQIKVYSTFGITLLNQSVLLKDVNDSAVVLSELSEKLFDVGVLPYYLHLLDPVDGASHFDVPKPVATKIMKELTVYLPGYLVPKLVQEVAGEESKIAVY
ncbi:MAG: EF-P beta-lysylation protein EpmB [Kangiella sp.]|nr:MAG: EF-P beta-lysylation protein EpmB [Kangiella sp.]